MTGYATGAGEAGAPDLLRATVGAKCGQVLDIVRGQQATA